MKLTHGVVAIGVLVIGTVSTARGQAIASLAADSSTIPDGKVLIPAGRIVDKSCVFEVPEGATVNEDHDVFKDGQLLHKHVPCTSEQMGFPSGYVADQNKKVQPPTIGHAWVDYTWANASTIGGQAFYDYLSAYWEVPTQPSVHGGSEVLFFFPSFQSSTEILQPVLQWGNNGDFGSSNIYTMASWYCWATGCHHSPGLGNVHEYDILFGEIEMVSNSPTAYYVAVQDTRSGVVSSYTWNVTGPFNTVQGGVLEAYNVTTCGNYSPDGATEFYLIDVKQAGPAWNSFNDVTPSWSDNVTGGLTPSCGYATQNGTNWTTVFY